MSILKPKKKKSYITYAFGEIVLIVIGILLALFINNRNNIEEYKGRIDANILRVYDDLNINIEQSRKTLYFLKTKDSLINLVMIDSLTAEDYYGSLDIPFLTIQNRQLSFEQKAIDNLNKIDVSGNNYKEELLSELREVNSRMEKVNKESQNIGDFISERCIPLLANNLKSFGDLTYKRKITEEALEFFLNSKKYKSLVAQYAIYAVRFQLDANRRYYKKALEVHSLIKKEYNLNNTKKTILSENRQSNVIGKFIREDYPDTLEIRYSNDSLLIGREVQGFVYLVPLDSSLYFLDGEGQQRYFVSFHKEKKSNVLMKLNLFSDRLTYRKSKKQ